MFNISHFSFRSGLQTPKGIWAPRCCSGSARGIRAIASPSALSQICCRVWAVAVAVGISTTVKALSHVEKMLYHPLGWIFTRESAACSFILLKMFFFNALPLPCLPGRGIVLMKGVESSKDLAVFQLEEMKEPGLTLGLRDFRKNNFTLQLIGKTLQSC